VFFPKSVPSPILLLLKKSVLVASEKKEE
jgi:hypothetical protein